MTAPENEQPAESQVENVVTDDVIKQRNREDATQPQKEFSDCF